jgi:hypothetical protein
MSIDLDAIERAAKGATPGPWESVQDRIYHEETARYIGNCAGLVSQSDQNTANAAHIATMDPDTTLALVDEVRRLRELEASIMAVVEKEIRT